MNNSRVLNVYYFDRYGRKVTNYVTIRDFKVFCFNLFEDNIDKIHMLYYTSSIGKEIKFDYYNIPEKLL